MFVNFVAMKNKNFVSYLSIILGGAVAIYANAETEQNVVFLVLGILLLMFGVYRLNASLSSKVKNTDSIGNYKDEEE